MNKILILVGIVVLASCGGLKDVSKFKKEDVVFSLKKGPCYGKCSVYNLDIYRNNYVVYEGVMNVEKYGIYAKKMKKNEILALKTAFDNESFYSFDDNYPIQNSELPTIAISYNKEMEKKTITGSLDRPQKILILQRLLEKVAKADDFKLVKAYEPKTSMENAEEKKEDKGEVIENQLIIELNSNVFMAQWLRKYSQYDVQLIKQVSPDLSYWLITYNKTKIAPADIMEKLKQDKELKFVEFNKRVSPRDK